MVSRRNVAPFATVVRIASVRQNAELRRCFSHSRFSRSQPPSPPTPNKPPTTPRPYQNHLHPYHTTTALNQTRLDSQQFALQNIRRSCRLRCESASGCARLRSRGLRPGTCRARDLKWGGGKNIPYKAICRDLT